MEPVCWATEGATKRGGGAHGGPEGLHPDAIYDKTAKGTRALFRATSANLLGELAHAHLYTCTITTGFIVMSAVLQLWFMYIMYR